MDLRRIRWLIDTSNVHLVKFHTEKAFTKRSLSHRFVNDVFIPMIPSACVGGTTGDSYDARYAQDVLAIKPKDLLLFNQRFWDAWSTFCSASDNGKDLEVFTSFATREYPKILHSLLHSPQLDLPFEMQARWTPRTPLKDISPTSGLSFRRNLAFRTKLGSIHLQLYFVRDLLPTGKPNSIPICLSSSRGGRS